MSKRAHKKHPRRKRDHYGTPAEPVAELLPFLAKGTRYVEPCAAEGLLVGHLAAAGHVCVLASDIEPLAPSVRRLDALQITRADIPPGSVVITNFPWSRELLHALILHLSDLAPVWALHDADWAHLTGTTKATRDFKACYARLRKVKSVGRVQWVFEGSRSAGFENSAWYYFDKAGHGPPAFYAKGEAPEPAVRPGRICFDCRVVIGPRDRWQLVERAGVATCVHRCCSNPTSAHPRGHDGLAPTPLFDALDAPAVAA